MAKDHVMRYRDGLNKQDPYSQCFLGKGGRTVGDFFPPVRCLIKSSPNA